jgi:hypothetical protein
MHKVRYLGLEFNILPFSFTSSAFVIEILLFPRGTTEFLIFLIIHHPIYKIKSPYCCRGIKKKTKQKTKHDAARLKSTFKEHKNRPD